VSALVRGTTIGVRLQAATDLPCYRGTSTSSAWKQIKKYGQSFARWAAIAPSAVGVHKKLDVFFLGESPHASHHNDRATTECCGERGES
jgi:hypothetical protein